MQNGTYKVKDIKDAAGKGNKAACVFLKGVSGKDPAHCNPKLREQLEIGTWVRINNKQVVKVV